MLPPSISVGGSLFIQTVYAAANTEWAATLPVSI